MENSTTTAIWITYDLGLRGNYARLYEWLDSKNARECGDSCAFIKYASTNSVREDLKNELTELLGEDSGARIYLIYKDLSVDKYKGAYILGRRKAAPWAGYAAKGGDAVDEA